MYIELSKFKHRFILKNITSRL